MFENRKITNYLFKFSIVTAVYNVAPYLSEAIDSILSQDIGFSRIRGAYSCR